jgi:hypothetical protein
MAKIKLKSKLNKSANSDWEIVDDIPMAQKGLSTRDSINVMGQKHIDLEHRIGYPGGNPNLTASMTGDRGINNVIDYVENQGYGSAMNQGQINSWLYNAGFDFDKKKQTINPKKYILGEYYRKYSPYKKEDWDANWGWKGRSTINDQDAEKLYKEKVSKLPEEEQRVLINLAKDWFYKNRSGVTPNRGVNPDGSNVRGDYGDWSSDYEKVWAPMIKNQFEYGKLKNTPTLDKKDKIDYNEYYERQTVPRQKKNGGSISQQGYRDDSPYKNRESIDIHSPNGLIDMSETGMPILANGRYLPPYSGMHQFEPGVVREERIMQSGGRAPLEISDPREFKIRNDKYTDSLNAYNSALKRLPLLEKAAYDKADSDRWIMEDKIKDVNKSNPKYKPKFKNSGYDPIIFNITSNRSSGDTETESVEFKYKKPVQPVVYKPTILDATLPAPITTVTPSTTSTYESLEPLRPKQTSIELPQLNTQISQEQPQPQPLEFNNIPFQKGSYFTVDRKGQQSGGAGFSDRRTQMTDYYNKKTGKKLGTYPTKKKSGGKINTEWEIIEDVNTYQKGGSVKDMYKKPINSKIKNTDESRSRYDSRFNEILLAEDYKNATPEQQERMVAHEGFHAKQFAEGKSRFITDRDIPYKRPSIVSTDEIYDNYHNRKQVESDIDVNNWTNQNPSFKFAPRQLVFNNIVDNQQYNNPYSLEGEATYYENSGEIPPTYQKGGKVVSEIWQEVTGTPWSEAKKIGLTKGGYEENLAIRKELLKNPEKFVSLINEYSKQTNTQTPVQQSTYQDPVQPSKIVKLPNANENNSFTARSFNQPYFERDDYQETPQKPKLSQIKKSAMTQPLPNLPLITNPIDSPYFQAPIESTRVFPQIIKKGKQKPGVIENITDTIKNSEFLQDVKETIQNIKDFDDVKNSLIRGLGKTGLYAPDTQEVEIMKIPTQKPIIEPIAKPTIPSLAVQDTTPTTYYQGKGIIDQRTGTEMGRYVNTFSNWKGQEYIPTKNVEQWKKDKSTIYPSSQMAHYLLDTDLTTGYQHDYSKKMLEKQKKGESITEGSTLKEQWLPVYEKLPNGNVRIKYKTNKESIHYFLPLIAIGLLGTF